MKILWAILCQISVVDRQTNNISLFNVVEDIQVVAPSPQLEPSETVSQLVTPQVFDLVIMLGRSDFEVPEKGSGRVRIMGPGLDAKESGSPPFEVDLTEFLRSRMIIKIPGIPIAGEGIYRLLVDCTTEGKEWGSPFELPIQVTVQTSNSC